MSSQGNDGVSGCTVGTGINKPFKIFALAFLFAGTKEQQHGNADKGIGNWP
jgi:hypothetical protein